MRSCANVAGFLNAKTRRRKVAKDLADFVLGHPVAPCALAPLRLCVESKNLRRPVISSALPSLLLFGSGSSGLGGSREVLRKRGRNFQRKGAEAQRRNVNSTIRIVSYSILSRSFGIEGRLCGMNHFD